MHLRLPRPCQPGRPGLVRAFKGAWEAGDIAALIGLLDPDATTIADGGGLVSAYLHPIERREQVARLYIDDIAARVPGLTIVETTVNGQPGLVAQLGGVTVTVYAFGFAGDRIKHHLGSTEPREAPTLDDRLTGHHGSRFVRLAVLADYG